MHKAKITLAIMAAVGCFALLGTGCESSQKAGDHPSAEHPKNGEHPQGEHPEHPKNGEHPEHPKNGEHPEGEHPNG